MSSLTYARVILRAYSSMVEREAYIFVVLGSSPSARTAKRKTRFARVFLLAVAMQLDSKDGAARAGHDEAASRGREHLVF